MTFLENFLYQCKLKGVSPSGALDAIGMSRSLYCKWKKQPEKMPYGHTVKKLCDYFGCPYEALETKTEIKTDKLDTYTLLNKCILSLSKKDREYLLSYVMFTYKEEIPDDLQRLWQGS